MDFRARPSKHTKFPPPLFLSESSSNLIYCHTCGRVITPRRSHTSRCNSTPVKYCSDRCRRNKPGPLDRQIEDAFLSLLEGNKQDYTEKYGAMNKISNDNELSLRDKQDKKYARKKGEQRVIVWCSEIQSLVFGHQFDQYAKPKRKINDATSNDIENENCQSMDFDEIQDDLSETEKSELGRKRAEEREMVRRAARRGVVFGFTIKDDSLQNHGKRVRNGKAKKGDETNNKPIQGEEAAPHESKQCLRMCEAVMTPNAIVVEPSFAKGDWGIRWRE